MARPLAVFISSTVEDFGPVREEIAARLKQRGVDVRLSESPEFPVLPGVSSHDACLKVVRDSDVFVLLIGQRFGGEYAGQNKSITWREWEEAIEHHLITIVLVEQRTNVVAREIWAERKALQAKRPSADPKTIDKLLAESFPDHKPFAHNRPGVQRFVDELRKGHKDNWLYSGWKGTVDDALKYIDSRCGAALAAYHARDSGIKTLAKSETNRVRALSRMTRWCTLLGADVRARELSVAEAQERMLTAIELERAELLGFDDSDRHNFMIYFRRGATLKPGPRVCHRRIQVRNRSWKVGEGHVGIAVRENAVLATGDLRQTVARSPSRTVKSDLTNYISAVSVPLYFRGDTTTPDGAFIVTSSRLDHFRDLDSVEVLTASTLARMIEMVDRS